MEGGHRLPDPLSGYAPVSLALALYERYEKKKDYHHCYIQNAPTAAADIFVISLLQQK